MDAADKAAASSVLFLLGDCNGEPCLILNKRSRHVRQPGDLCCPGGGIHSRLDPVLAKVIALPFLPLGRWPYWKGWRRRTPRRARLLSLLLATGLREGVEEMRLNPFRVRFLGVLPPEPLVMFRRTIYPMVAWLPHPQRFYTNWEVEKIVSIPLSALLDPERYRQLHLYLGQSEEDSGDVPEGMVLPCFVHETPSGGELLWGATYRITTVFLKMAFDFSPPPAAALPSVAGFLDQRYLGGGK
ncbi:MAG: NUDIX hydrolase [Thermodesulfobacteriota bacterium]